MRDVEKLVADAQASAFDIDAVSDADLIGPRLPQAPFGWARIVQALQQPALMPAGVVVKLLDADSWAIQLPGMAESARVTARPALFDEHFSSMQLLWYGGAVFAGLIGPEPGVQSEVVAQA